MILSCSPSAGFGAEVRYGGGSKAERLPVAHDARAADYNSRLGFLHHRRKQQSKYSGMLYSERSSIRHDDHGTCSSALVDTSNKRLIK